MRLMEFDYGFYLNKKYDMDTEYSLEEGDNLESDNDEDEDEDDDYDDDDEEDERVG